jgi:pimeloyl-[acyl-carrier protein] synthase
MVRQMLFMDAPAHTRLRTLASQAFTSARVQTLRTHIEDIAERLMGDALESGEMDVVADFAAPLPAIVTAELLGVPTSDHRQLKAWSADFAEMLGNFQHNPDRIAGVLRSVAEMTAYFHSAIKELRQHPCEGLIYSFMTAEVNGDRFTDEEIVANCIITMVGGQETTTNLIANGALTLLRNPAALADLRRDPLLIKPAVEELLRFESPSQHTARLAPYDFELGHRKICKRDALIAVMAAGNRDPERFAEPDTLDLSRENNHHLAFGWGAHFCFGAPLARMEGQIAFETMLRRMPVWSLVEAAPLVWRMNLGLRGLESLRMQLNPNLRASVNRKNPAYSSNADEPNADGRLRR